MQGVIEGAASFHRHCRERSRTLSGGGESGVHQVGIRARDCVAGDAERLRDRALTGKTATEWYAAVSDALLQSEAEAPVGR